MHFAILITRNQINSALACNESYLQSIIDKESDTHMNSVEYTKLRLDTKKTETFHFVPHGLNSNHHRNISLNFTSRRCVSDVIRFEMCSERIFLFVTVALMELSDYSAVRRHDFIT